LPTSQPIRRKTERQKTCIDRKCKAELRRFPLAYSWPEKQKTGNHPSDAITASKTPDFVDSERPLSGDRPSFKCLAHWWWGGDPDSGDHSLYDKEGLTLARLVRGPDGFYHLRSPLTWPRMSWGELEQAKHHAESLALASLPLDRKLAARIKRDNETPHPMGPLNRSWPVNAGHGVFRIAESKTPGDPGPIPEFLRRAPAVPLRAAA
jgi:hypothetical protein